MNTLFNNLLDMVYPRYCVGCNAYLSGVESVVCLSCRNELIYTGFFLTNENPVAEKFIGRLKIEKAGSLFFYSKDSIVQRLLFDLKYRNNKQSGSFMATILAQKLFETDWAKGIDFIIPIPLNKKKEKVRGYNQAGILAHKLGKLLHIPVNENIVARPIFTETQTHKTRGERLLSMQNVFEIVDKDSLKGKHVLLLDDVITSGATLEVCGAEILKIPETKLSIITIAYAM